MKIIIYHLIWLIHKIKKTLVFVRSSFATGFPGMDPFGKTRGKAKKLILLTLIQIIGNFLN
ncbi:MAG: hypothetical protein A2Y94_13445 [Caldithrix sp. RBG_13_44_9]|nr:MAG: hypothetical protein A2Y94_13445 [Caldithrix sp. RBG_13_44_9]